MEAATHLKYTASLVSLFTGLWGLYYLYQQNKKKSKWVHVGYLDEIFIYPIKGGKGKSVTSAYLGPLGLKSGLLRDREFMIVDKKYTQKRKLKIIHNLHNLINFIMIKYGIRTTDLSVAVRSWIRITIRATIFFSCLKICHFFLVCIDENHEYHLKCLLP